MHIFFAAVGHNIISSSVARRFGLALSQGFSALQRLSKDFPCSLLHNFVEFSRIFCQFSMDFLGILGIFGQNSMNFLVISGDVCHCSMNFLKISRHFCHCSMNLLGIFKDSPENPLRRTFCLSTCAGWLAVSTQCAELSTYCFVGGCLWRRTWKNVMLRVWNFDRCATTTASGISSGICDVGGTASPGTCAAPSSSAKSSFSSGLSSQRLGSATSSCCCSSMAASSSICHRLQDGFHMECPCQPCLWTVGQPHVCALPALATSAFRRPSWATSTSMHAAKPEAGIGLPALPRAPSWWPEASGWASASQSHTALRGQRWSGLPGAWLCYDETWLWMGAWMPRPKAALCGLHPLARVPGRHVGIDPSLGDGTL